MNYQRELFEDMVVTRLEHYLKLHEESRVMAEEMAEVLVSVEQHPIANAAQQAILRLALCCQMAGYRVDDVVLEALESVADLTGEIDKMEYRLNHSEQMNTRFLNAYCSRFQ